MIVGTAGHVDHGKSALVRALTGIETDRLAEEKRRGISIDLGFAYMPTADGAVIGFVDVPGHEHFIRNMLAGATGIDFMLLVIAADDGIKPQTIEHLAILDLLGLSRGLVALSKIDLVPPSRRAAVRHDIAGLLAGTGMAGIEIVEVSTVTGDGIDALRSRLITAAPKIADRDAHGRFRLAIDRCFTLRGIGTVVTGTVLSGAVAVGDHVVISPSSLPARVRSIHAQNQPAAHGTAGQRCALNLAGDDIAKDAIGRGDMAVAADLHAPTARIDACLRVLPSETKPLGLWLPARLHHGAAEVGARIVPLGAAPLEAGSEGWVQLVLDRPLATAVGDRFVLRDTAAQRTIGGGRFVDLRAPARRRRTPERLARLAVLALDDPDEAFAKLLDLAPFFLDLDAFRRDWALARDGGEEMACIRLAARATTYAVSQTVWDSFQNSLISALAQFHAGAPDAKGVAPDRLRAGVEPRWPAPVFNAALEELARHRIIVLDGRVVCLPDHETRLTPAQDALWQKVHPLLSDAERFRPPRLAEIAQSIGNDEAELRRFLKLAAGFGLVEEVVPDHFLLRSAVQEVATTVAELARSSQDGAFGAAQLRDRLNTGRKVAIELLEYFDRRGVTLRRGDRRRVDPHRLQSFLEGARDPIARYYADTTGQPA